MAINRVSVLTRPINIVKIKINLLAKLRSAVIPLLSPTVLYADTHSKEMFNKFLSGSNNEILRIDIEITNTERTIIAKALLTVVEDISRLYTSSRDFPLAILKILSNAIAKELVLIPPPVELGEAPTHIRKITINRVGMLNAAVSTVLKPAVLVVTAPKKAVAIFPAKPCSDNVLLYSKRKNRSVEPTIRTKVVIKTIRVLIFINPGIYCCRFML